MTKLRSIVISGPSGCGKSTLLSILFENFKGAFGFSVSHTSRLPRKGEINGTHYHFSSRETMMKDINEFKFLEHAEFSGNLYGTSKRAVDDVLKRNQICVLDLEEQGVRSIKETDLDALFIFIKPPSILELRERLNKRGTESPATIEKRMKTAQSAISFSDQPGIYDVVIVNDQLQTAYEELQNFLTSRMPILNKMRTSV